MVNEQTHKIQLPRAETEEVEKKLNFIKLKFHETKHFSHWRIWKNGCWVAEKSTQSGHNLRVVYNSNHNIPMESWLHNKENSVIF